MDIADEFINLVTNFGCRLAKHRGGDTLEVRDVQLHLGAWLFPLLCQASWLTYSTTNSERNHTVWIPGFAPDMTPATQSVQSAKKGAQGMQNSVRAHRLAQVAQAKQEAKLMPPIVALLTQYFTCTAWSCLLMLSSAGPIRKYARPSSQQGPSEPFEDT